MLWHQYQVGIYRKPGRILLTKKSHWNGHQLLIWWHDNKEQPPLVLFLDVVWYKNDSTLCTSYESINGISHSTNWPWENHHCIYIVFKYISSISVQHISSEKIVSTSLDLFGDGSILVQILAWNRQATHPKVNQCNQYLWRHKTSLRHNDLNMYTTWWRHQMETFSSLLGLCARNSPVTGEFPARKSETWSFDVFFDVRLKKRLSKQWFETQSRSLWRHCNKLVHVKFNKLNTTSRRDTDKCRQE